MQPDTDIHHPRDPLRPSAPLRVLRLSADGCSCQKTVPASVVSAAWARELERAPAREDQFFRFLWRGGEWLAYGLRDGRVRGVYCPEHSARRAERSWLQRRRVRVGVAS